MGVRKLIATRFFVESLLALGNDAFVPVKPIKLEILGVRMIGDRIEAIVRSDSFDGASSATWDTAETWTPSFRKAV